MAALAATTKVNKAVMAEEDITSPATHMLVRYVCCKFYQSLRMRFMSNC